MKRELFIESLRVEEGHFQNSGRHYRRITDTLRECFGKDAVNPCPFPEDAMVPDDMRRGIVKCRYVYGLHDCKIGYQMYVSRRIRTLRLVEGGSIDYHLKYADRSGLLALREQRGDCDDILIVKNGELTDTSYSNIVLFDGRRYVTPRAFLLNGIRRRSLLDRGAIEEQKITPQDLRYFQRLYLVNALLGIEDGICLEPADVF